MKTQYKKVEKRKWQSRKHKYRFSVLTSKKKTHFRDSCQVHHGINKPLYRIAKSENVLCSANIFAFCLLYLVYKRVLVCSSEARTLVYDKHTSKCHIMICNFTTIVFLYVYQIVHIKVCCVSFR